MSRRDAASDRLADLIGDAEVIEVSTYSYHGHTILVAQLVGDPEDDGEGYYGDLAVAWDAGLDRDGERGACYLSLGADTAIWFALRWPATTKAPGFLRDGSWGRP